MKSIVRIVVLVAVVGACLAPLGFARVVYNTIDPIAVVTDHGRQLLVTGPITCTAGEQAHFRVTVTQRETGAMAEGHALVTCTGVNQQWELHASTQGSELFQEGPATAVAIARTSDRGAVTDAHQWLVAITLVRQ
jgi:hypothetical protein